MCAPEHMRYVFSRCAFAGTTTHVVRTTAYVVSTAAHVGCTAVHDLQASLGHVTRGPEGQDPWVC